MKMKMNEEQNKEIKKQIVALVKQSEHPEKEMCGVIVKAGKKIYVRPVDNVSETSQLCHYVMSPKHLGEQTEDTNLYRATAENEFIGFWHTHPHHDSLPSQIDITNCMLGKLYYIYSIVEDNMRIFKIDGVY